MFVFIIFLVPLSQSSPDSKILAYIHAVKTAGDHLFHFLSEWYVVRGHYIMSLHLPFKSPIHETIWKVPAVIISAAYNKGMANLMENYLPEKKVP